MTSILKPGLLVSLKTSIRGGVTYARKDLDTGEIVDPDADVSRWETTRVIADAEEYERARKARSTATIMLRRECTATSFGLLCPAANEEALDAAVERARDLARRFNAGASHSDVSVFVLKGRIAETDEEATRAIADEVAGLLDAMERGVREFDVKSIRDAANRARAMGEMLEARESETVGRAIEAARKAARTIVKRVEKGGESAEAVARDLWTGPIEKARFAFLEAGADVQREGEALPAVSPQRFAHLDDESDDNDGSAAPAPARGAIDAV